MTLDNTKMTDRVEQYRQLSKDRQELEDRLESVLGKMDTLWWSMTEEEQNIVDPEGAAFRPPHNRSHGS